VGRATDERNELAPRHSITCRRDQAAWAADRDERGEVRGRSGLRQRVELGERWPAPFQLCSFPIYTFGPF